MDTNSLRVIARDIEEHAYLDCHPIWAQQITRSADTIERLQKEFWRQKLALQEVKTANMELAQLRPSHLKQERDAALAEVERLKVTIKELQEGFDAELAASELAERL